MIIQGKNVFIDGAFRPARIETDGGRIRAIRPYGGLPEADFDFSDARIVPGFYDVHTHGYGGYDTNDGTEDGLRVWLREIAREGVCGICPTLVTQSREVLSKALRNVAALARKEYEGARILGIHLEGPFLDREYRGAQPERYCVRGTVGELEGYVKDAGGLLRILTIAPEHDEGFRIIRYCAEHGINASLGHSGATYECAREAVKAGARGFTHTFNGMSPFTHRQNGMAGAALLSDECWSELICDAFHCSAAAKKLFFRAKPIDRAVMVSDALKMKGLPAGSKGLFGGQEVEVREGGDCRLAGTDRLAGSTMRMNDGLRRLVEEVGLPFGDAIRTCTVNPAEYLRIGDRGLLREGFLADVTVLDGDYSVLATFTEGKRAF